MSVKTDFGQVRPDVDVCMPSVKENPIGANVSTTNATDDRTSRDECAVANANCLLTLTAIVAVLSTGRQRGQDDQDGDCP